VRKEKGEAQSHDNQVAMGRWTKAPVDQSPRGLTLSTPLVLHQSGRGLPLAMILRYTAGLQEAS